MRRPHPLRVVAACAIAMAMNASGFDALAVETESNWK